MRGDKGDFGQPQAIGRLVLVVERELSEASRGRLRDMLGTVWEGGGDVTWVSGLSRASVMAAGAETDHVFYNRGFLPPEDAVSLMPWREVWLVAGGKVWKLQEDSIN